MGTFGQRLRELRKQRGISQNELSKHIGVSKSSVNMYERDEREPGFETLEAIADFFNVNMDYLLGKYSPLDIWGDTVDPKQFSKPARIVLSKLLYAFANNDSKNFSGIWKEAYETFTFSDMKHTAELLNSLFIAFIEESLNSDIDEDMKKELKTRLEEQKQWKSDLSKITSDNTEGTE